MKRAHRKAHALIWILLLPAMLVFTYLAADMDNETRIPTTSNIPGSPEQLP